MKNKIPKRDFQVTYGGTLGNFTIKIDNTMSGGVTDEKIEEIQKGVYQFCNLGSLCFTNQLLDPINDHCLDQLDVNLKRFVSDVDYYYEIFDHNRPVYNMITDWFTNKIGPFWNEVNTWMFNLNENVDKTELKIFWEVMNFGLNHYPTDEIRDGKHMLEDLMDCIDKDTEWDVEGSINTIRERENGFKGNVLDREGETFKMEMV